MAKKDKDQNEAPEAVGAVQGPGEVTEAPGEGEVAEDPSLQEVPVHPPEPGPGGSSPHPNPLPVGPQGEDVRHETDDIDADGTPITSKGFVEASPEIDGESDRRYDEIARAHWRPGPADQAGLRDDKGALVPLVNQHSPEGARLDEIKLQRPVVYIPNDATLDPVAHNPSPEQRREQADAFREVRDRETSAKRLAGIAVTDEDKQAKGAR
jgi:hypothetical protein